MGRKLHPRWKKDFFDPTLAFLGGNVHNKYVDIYHKDAARKIQLHNLTRRIREPVNQAGVRRIAPDAVIHGLFNTKICSQVRNLTSFP